MANYSTLKAAVEDVVKTNGTQAITGANLQAVLLSIINSLGGGGYIFKGVATPSTSAGTPDENVFYVGGAGTYANFGTSVTVPVGSICVFKYNGSWVKEQIKMFDGIDDVPTVNSNNLVKSGGVYDEFMKNTPFKSIVKGSSYYVSTLTNAWMINNQIERNEYTSPYSINLFRVPAGNYAINKPSSNLSQTVIFVGTIDSANDFVVGGTISEVLFNGAETKKKVVTFDSETLVCVLLRGVSQYCDFGSVVSNEEINNKITNTLPYTQNGLLGVKKGTVVEDLIPTQNGDLITSDLFSQFFLDMKIVGSVEDNTEYRFDYFQYWKNGYDQFSNYLRIVKSSNNWSSTTTVVSYVVGQNAPTGIKLYEFTPNNSTLTKIYLLLNWGALSNINTGTASSVGANYNIPQCYKFDMEYLMNMEYGNIPNLLSYRNSIGLPERIEEIEDAVYEPVNLDTTSPYFVDELRDAWMFQGTIQRNEYTARYRILLFRVPAGKYQLDNMGHIASNQVTLVGRLASESALVVDGAISYTYLAASSTPNSINIELSEETLIVMLGDIPRGLNYFSSVGKLEIADWGEEIEDIFKVNLDIVIPDIVYAIVGSELNIWNDTISLSVDKGLHSPANYSVLWSCNKGLITDRCFRFTPTASDVGNVSCTCTVYDMRGVLVTSKTFTIKVLAKNALASAKKIVYFGDSLGQSAASCLYSNFHNTERFTGTIPNMLGTMGTTAHCEAVGGYKWSSYATEGESGYRIFVSNVTALSIGAVYSDGQHNFEIYEVNITDGTGNCLLTRHYTSAGTLIMPSGTLTKVSGAGDNTAPYTGAYEESANPLWNDTTQQLDINQYKQTLVNLGQLSSTSDKIDAVSFQFGINDHAMANNLNTLKGYITSLYNLFISDNPNCKFIVGLTTSSGNDVNGSGANYGATWDWKQYLEDVYKIKKFYLSLLAELPNMRIATPNLYLDRYYGYGFSTRQISDRYTETEQYHNNYVHPASSGYYQMADAYLAAYVAVLTE